MKNRIISVITNEKKRTRAQYICVFIVLGLVSLLMTLLNIITDKGALTWATAAFTLLCLLNLLIVYKWKHAGVNVASALFMAEIITLFTFFIISGNPDGFSVIWIAMLPTCGMLLFGIRRTAVLCSVLFIILVFFFWIPAGAQFLQYDYNKTFMMRFPILYAAFFATSALFETIRVFTQKELDKLRERYKELAAHDNLTKLLNRQGFIELVKNTEANENQTVFMIDIDHFKNVNDNYGHDIGDLVLFKIGEKAEQSAVSAKACRWGGEEFVLWFPTGGGDPEAIRAVMDDLNQRRRDKQPLSQPSAGSFFKRPEGDYAARLIETAGLKGFRVGGAAVSDKHAGFVVNLGDATAKDVLQLMFLVQERVEAQSGIRLAPEVRIVGVEG